MNISKNNKAHGLNPKATLEDKWSPSIAKCGHTALPNVLLICSKQLNITAPEFMTLAALLSFKWDGRRPNPSVRKLCELTNGTPRTVRKHLASLENKGVIVRVPRSYQTNEYDFTPLITRLDRFAKDLVDSPEEPGEVVVDDQGPWSAVTAKEYPVEESKINKNIEMSNDIAESTEQIQAVYDYFIEKFESNPKLFKLTPKRKSKIRTRLKDCGYDMLKQTIDNVAATSFYRGDNERGWKADLDFIIRSYEQVEKFSQLNASAITYKADW